VREGLRRRALFAGGWVSLALGVASIPLPVLPTTPFVLLSAWCFARSSPRFHYWLLHHRLFGAIIKNFDAGRGLPRRVRRRAILLIWATMSVSALLLGSPWVTALLAVIGIAVTVYLLRLPCYDPPAAGGA
jgi:uncharacterized membrane protein YbaN (DUF454 family)